MLENPFFMRFLRLRVALRVALIYKSRPGVGVIYGKVQQFLQEANHELEPDRDLYRYPLRM